ncbi:MAG: ABC transporter substrate-binding protein [Thermoleophilia bacterium]|nr:ABC transporter substrate-binding protein [Thermoleophilia bacterium]MDH5333660.1 ABC transporter substrate-binding protein [Thermoleophilia bacterium]
MTRRLGIAAAAALLVLAAATAAGAGGAADPGVTATEIVIGGTVPLSGEAAAFGSVGPGAKAYFDYVNARGGVNGRKIRYVFYDDAYNPAQTVQLTRRLVEQDRVLAIFNSVGTANNLAIREYLNAQKVPQLLVGDGSEALGGAPLRYPWTMGFLQSYRGEGAVYGRDIAARTPKARLAVLFENTELGKEMTQGLSRAIARKGPKVVASESYELVSTDVSAQVARLKASGADTLLVFATPKFMIQALLAATKLGWKPRTYIASLSIEPTIMDIAKANAPALTNGARSVAFVKNPRDPIWAKDPAVKLYRSIMTRFNPGGRPTDVYNWYGMTVAWTMVDVLGRAGKVPTRASLLRAARSIDTRANPFLLPGIRLKTGLKDSFPLDTVYLYRYENRTGQWVRASGLLAAR